MSAARLSHRAGSLHRMVQDSHIFSKASEINPLENIVGNEDSKEIFLHRFGESPPAAPH